MSVAPASLAAPHAGRWRRAYRLLKALISLKRRTFFIAVAGAGVFALCTVLSSLAVQWVIDHAIVPRFEEDEGVSTTTVLAGMGLIIGIGVLRAAGVVVRRTFAGMTTARIIEHLTMQVVEKVAAQPAPWHRRHLTGDLVARAGVDVEATTWVLNPLPFATGTVMMVLFSGTWLLLVDAPLGLLAVAMFPVIIGINIVYQRQVESHYDTAQDYLGDLSAAVHESFEGVQVVKAFGAEGRETDRLSEIAANLRTARTRAIILRGTFESLLDAIPSLTNILVVVLGAVRVRSGAMTVGELSGFVFLFTMLVMPLRLIGYALSELPRSSAGYARVTEITSEALEPDPRSSITVAPDGVGLALEGVSFTHDGERMALDDIDLTVSAGQTVALVGATGSGKSTLLQTVAGVVAATSGAVGVAPGELCLVFQEAFLLGGTLRENVAMGREVDDDAIWHALDLAEARGFVSELSERLDTVVGERGISLSGGQRQRVALARALLRRPTVLLLDDTTSALDPSTEGRVLANLRSAFAGTTVLIVASRPSTIALADEVVFMQDGRVVAHGSHPSLVQSIDSYRDLVEAFETDRATSLNGDAAGASDAESERV